MLRKYQKTTQLCTTNGIGVGWCVVLGSRDPAAASECGLEQFL